MDNAKQPQESQSTETSKWRRADKVFKENIDTMCKEVELQRDKLKAAVDSIADSVIAELVSMGKGNAKDMIPKQPDFVTGSSDLNHLHDCFGKIDFKNLHENIAIDTKHVKCLSSFSISPASQIYSICPVDDIHAWLSVEGHRFLLLVHRDGSVLESVDVGLRPCKLAMFETTDIYMTSNGSAIIHKLSLDNKKVALFTNLCPHVPYDISINGVGEVFVSTIAAAILVFNQSGQLVRQLKYEWKCCGIACLSNGYMALSVELDDSYSRNIIIKDSTGTTVQTWTGELTNGQYVSKAELLNVVCDIYDRVFFLDYTNDRVCVIPRDGKQAATLLEEKHGVSELTSIGVTNCGDVLWLGNVYGNVHVIQF